MHIIKIEKKKFRNTKSAIILFQLSIRIFRRSKEIISGQTIKCIFHVKMNRYEKKIVAIKNGLSHMLSCIKTSLSYSFFAMIDIMSNGIRNDIEFKNNIHLKGNS